MLPLLAAAEAREDLVPRDLAEVVSLAVALGAIDVGGPLSSEERRLIRLASHPPTSFEAVRESILQGLDPLGDAICALRSRAERRDLGAFYTPPTVVKNMVTWALKREPLRFVDPGCGSGRFAAEAIRQNPDLEIVAVDVDPLATLACRAVLATLGAKRTLVINRDYTSMSFPASAGTTAFVGNPPYVRHHRLTAAQKAKAKRAAAELGIDLSGLAGLHVHFFLATLRHARPGDVGCFITSSEWLDVSYGAALRIALLDGMGGVGLHLLAPEVAAFDDAMTTAVITCFEVGKTSTGIRMRSAATISALGDLDSGGRIVPLSRLREARRWTPLFRAGDRQGRAGHVRLGEIVRVSRGAVTGANRFFVMSEKDARRLGLEKYVVPALTSAQEVLSAEGIVRADASRRVFLDPPATVELESPEHEALRRYLAAGDQEGVPKSYICSHRHPWWRVGAKYPPIVATYMARQPPAFALNPDGLAILNVLHGLFPKVPLDQDQLLGLVRYLNDHREELRGRGRTYQGGLEKFEPREMEAIEVPAPSELGRYANH
ncbi:MAG: methyltransferase [Acidothermus sp.]|nr:methyltransferase [Acidothermus sp.]